MPNECLRREDGAALVEAALVMPILLMLVLGLVDLGLYFWNANLAAKAVQLGVRRAIVSDSVAVGPGLDRDASETYWHGLPPGLLCFPTPTTASACPTFDVSCDVGAGCRCAGGGCPYTFSVQRMQTILGAMQAVMPALRADNVRISYATNGLGYVGRPVPVSADVTVTLIGMHYRPLFLADVLGAWLPLRASAQLPGESLGARGG